LVLNGRQEHGHHRGAGLARTFKKRKRTVEAVRGVDLTVGDGEIVGFLGPNGAGKTTTHQPRLVFLDEPTTGLDPQSRSNLWEHISRLRSELGTTVFLTTHYLEEADVLCDRVFVIDYGMIVAEGTPDELKRRISGDVVTLRVTGEEAIARKLLADQDVVREMTSSDGTLRRPGPRHPDQLRVHRPGRDRPGVPVVRDPAC
jgi:ABC-type multidrug transport system ATPase subunit